MNLKKLTMVPMLAMALFAVGCGADCESACEDAKECDGATDAQKDADCAKVCEDAQKAAEKAGCEEEYDDFWSCAGGEDVCDPDENACKEESSAWVKCMGLDEIPE
jgi:hypothetical protein